MITLIQYLSLIPIIHVNHNMIICLLNRFIPLIQLRYVLSVKIYITNLWNSLSRSIKVPKGFRAPGLRGSGLKIAGLWGSGAPGLRTTINRAPGLPRNWSRTPGSAILFCFNPWANPIIKKVQQFLHSTRISQLSWVIYQSWSMDAFNIWHSEWRVRVPRLKRGRTRISSKSQCNRSTKSLECLSSSWHFCQ